MQETYNVWTNYCAWIKSLTDLSKGDPVMSFLLGNRSWQTYMPAFYDQKYGNYDTNDCWDFSGLKDIAAVCNFLMANNFFSPEAIAFFKAKGYLDQNGLFAFSERYISIVSGVEGNGNQQLQAGLLAASKASQGKGYGLIPRSMLSYSAAQANACATELDFAADYYNPAVITDEMYELGEQFLQYVNIDCRYIGTIGTTPSVEVLNNALQIAPLQVGIPIESPEIWNQNIVPACTNKIANHAVAGVLVDTDTSVLINDQYQPEYKKLSPGYLLFAVSQFIITPVIS